MTNSMFSLFFCFFQKYKLHLLIHPVNSGTQSLRSSTNFPVLHWTDNIVRIYQSLICVIRIFSPKRDGKIHGKLIIAN